MTLENRFLRKLRCTRRIVQETWRRTLVGCHQAEERKIEIRFLEKERLNSQINLMKLGKIAQKHISFWEYTRIIRTTFQSTEPLAITDGSTTSLSTQATNKTQTTSKSTTLVKQSSSVQYTIFAFYEAYLLKKLHIAMMLKTQRKLQAMYS